MFNGHIWLLSWRVHLYTIKRGKFDCNCYIHKKFPILILGRWCVFSVYSGGAFMLKTVQSSCVCCSGKGRTLYSVRRKWGKIANCLGCLPFEGLQALAEIEGCLRTPEIGCYWRNFWCLLIPPNARDGTHHYSFNYTYDFGQIKTPS